MINAQQAFAAASNIVDGDDPEYTVDDFRDAMPGFKESIISDEQLAVYVNMAHSAVKEARWKSLWLEGMRLYIAHFATLYVQTALPRGATVDEILNAGRVQGAVSSKSVGGVSVSLDNSAAASDLTGWGQWKLTVYGQQFASLARMVGKGMMLVR